MNLESSVGSRKFVHTINMNIYALVAVCVSAVVLGQEPLGYNRIPLPDGVELIVGEIVSSFSCHDRDYGYYADVANHCTIFHVCQPRGLDENGASKFEQFAFFCSNLTTFNQLTLNCDYSENVPCADSESYYGINQFFGITDKPLPTTPPQ